MKRIKSLLLFSLLLLPVGVNAQGSAYISSNSTVVNGNNITASINLSNVAAWNIKASGSGSTSGCSIHEVGDSGNGNNTNKKFYITCKATSLGTIKFEYSGDVTSSDGVNTNVSGSKEVTVVKPREKSTNNNLKDLSVEGYELTPSFSKDVLEYTVNLNSNVEKIKINTKLEDGYANVSGNGEKEVEEGTNKFEIVVTSETGSRKTYILNVIVKDNNPITKTIDDEEYSVVKRGKSLVLPEVLDEELFKLSTVKIDDFEVPAYISEELNLTLVGLKDKDGNIYLFKVENDNITGKYEVLTNANISIVFGDPKEIIDGYDKASVSIDGKNYTAYKNKDTILLYGTNLETEEENWYRYDDKEKTIQIYDDSLVKKLNSKEKEFNDTLELYKYIILGLAGLCFLLLIIIIALIVSKSKLRKKVNRSINTLNKKQEEAKENENVSIEEKEIATKVEEKVEIPVIDKTSKKDKKKNKKEEEQKQAASEIAKVEEELKEDISEEEIIPSVEEIEEDLKESSKDDAKQEEDELVSVEEFFDLKKKKRK